MAKKKDVLSLKDILKRKEYFKNRKNETKELYVKSLDANIVIAKIDRELYLEALDMERGEGDIHLVYNSIVEPNVKDTDLHKEFDISVPCEILDVIFEAGEITNISNEILKFSGYMDSVEAIEELKN
jgi:hypothetical protein